MELNEFYNLKVKELSEQISLRQRRNKWFVMSEISGAVGVIGAVVGVAFNGILSWEIILCVISFLLWFTVTRIDISNGKVIEKLSALKSVYVNELCYLNGTFPFPDGEEYIDSNHEFSFDLDVFGKNSLFNRLCRCVTSGGADYLANCFKYLKYRKNQPEAIGELADNEPILTEFKSYRYVNGQVIDSKGVLKSVSELSNLTIGKVFSGVIILIVAWLAIIGLVISIFLSAFGVIGANVPLLWGTLQFFVVFSFCSGSIRKMSKVSEALRKSLVGYTSLIKLIREKEFKSEQLAKLRNSLDGSDRSFYQLDKFLRGLDSRGNIFGLIIFNTFLLSDLFLIRRFCKWQKLYSGRMEEWIKVVSEFDAIVSMATLKFNHPETNNANVVEDKKIIFETQGLWHPFLGKEAKKNNFNIKDKSFYIITGANMAGKSTFLRAVGVNYILAMNGMPIFADKLTVSCFKLFSSMRTQDDLSHGISYFNAELIRLKQLIDFCDAPIEGETVPTLIILDEILKGTNSMDKLNGSRLFLEAMEKKNVSGVIATHDLELSKMSEEFPKVFHNYCFEIKVGENVTYDYKISEGVARNQNATYLLKKVLDDKK